MKQVILIKNTKHPEIGHLYEHLFAMELVKLFRDNGLFSFTDYWLDARASHGGYVAVNLSLYTKRALAIHDQIYQIVPDFSKENIDRALVQIFSENLAGLRYIDYKKTTQTLDKLQKQDWQSMDQYSQYDAQQTKRSWVGLGYLDKQPKYFRQMRMTISLDSSYANNNRQMAWPIFHVLARALMQNIVEELDDHYLYYPIKREAKFSAKKVSFCRTFRIDALQSTGLSDELEHCKDLIKDMLNHDFVKVITGYLQFASYTKEPYLMDYDEFYQDTLMLIGEQGWKTIGTEQNIKEVLKNCTISFAFGKDKQLLEISKLVKK